MFLQLNKTQQTKIYVLFIKYDHNYDLVYLFICTPVYFKYIGARFYVAAIIGDTISVAEVQTR